MIPASHMLSRGRPGAWACVSGPGDCCVPSKGLSPDFRSQLLQAQVWMGLLKLWLPRQADSKWEVSKIQIFGL